jgi:signal transduction histidine kinase
MSPEEEARRGAAALQDMHRILAAHRSAEQELIKTKEALEEETRILELLNRTGATLASKLDLQSLVQAVTDAATELSGAQFGAFFYTAKNAEGDGMSLYTLSGAPREAFERFGHPRATPVFAPTFNGEAVVRVGDIRNDPRYGRMGPHHGMPAGHLPVASYLAVSVVARSGEVLGGLFFGHRLPDVFTERSERLVIGVAAQAAIAIDNARLYEEARRSADERARLLEAERATRAEIERISQMKDEFLSTLSHELRTPLHAVLGWSEILRARAKGDPQTQRGLETISRNARAQAQLIEDLLDMNRIVSGKLLLDVGRVDLAATVGAALDAIGPSATAKGVEVHPVVGPEVLAVCGDPDRLQQIVWNLLTNAVKFTPKGGRLDVSVVRAGASAEVTVRDSGAGIRPEFLPHLFERFRQADSSTTRRYGGLGLGLSIVKALVELHGGEVRAESPGEGAGATFTVSLPLLEADDFTVAERVSAPGRHSNPPGPGTSLAGLTVLIVDDEQDARDVVRTVLADAGAEVLTACSAREALALLTARRPDVLVSDIGMPERDGYLLLRDVRALPADAGGATPAIALTAFARPEDRARATRAGFQMHLSKPIEPRELLASVRSLAPDA